MANVGPATTYSYAVQQLGGASLQTWIPNAALFPLIGLQPIWVCKLPDASLWGLVITFELMKRGAGFLG